MQTQHRGEPDERQETQQDVDRVLDPHTADRQLPADQRQRNDDQLLRVEQHSAKFAEDKLLRRDVGDEQQFQRLRVLLRRDRRHSLSIDQQQRQQSQRHEANSRLRDHAQQQLAAAAGRPQRPAHDSRDGVVDQLDEDHPSAIRASTHFSPDDRVVPDGAMLHAGRAGRVSFLRRWWSERRLIRIPHAEPRDAHANQTGREDAQGRDRSRGDLRIIQTAIVFKRVHHRQQRAIRIQQTRHAAHQR